MAASWDDLKTVGRDGLRTYSVRGGEALEAYARALQAFGRGETSPEALARDIYALGVRGSVAATAGLLQAWVDYARWAASAFGLDDKPAEKAAKD
ncbi:MAG: hypothetical protein R3F55_03485 [Alphaproteobacteria bacterium]